MASKFDDGFIVASPWARQRIQRLLHHGQQKAGKRQAFFIEGRQALGLDPRIQNEVAASIEGQAHEYDADEGKLAPHSRRTIDRRHHETPVDMQAPCRDLTDNLSRPRRKAQNLTVFDDPDLRDSAGTREFSMTLEMPSLAVHRNQKLRLQPVVEPPQLLLARMSGAVHWSLIGGEDADTLAGQIVDDRTHRLLVAGDGLGRKHDRIAFFEADDGMTFLGNASQGRARLTLAAGAQQQGPLGWQVAERLLIEELRFAGKKPDCPRAGDHAAHGPAGDHDVPTCCPGGAGCRCNPADVRAEGRDRYAPARFADNALKGLRDIVLGRREAGSQGIGRVADQGADTFATDGMEPRFIEVRGNGGRRVYFPIAGVKGDAERSADHQGVGFGDGMSNPDVFQLERPKRKRAA
jgi:hypothetical protein